MAEPQAAQQTADIRAMDRNAPIAKLHAKLIQRQIAILLKPLAHPSTMRVQLAAANMSLPPRRQRTGLAFQLHHVVNEARRHPEMPRGSAVAVAFLDKRNNATTQLNRM